MMMPMDRTNLRAASLVRVWLRCYTAGASPQQRERRVCQIESDLWEHQADAATRGAGRAALSLAITDRMVRGIPADIAWRTRLGGFAMNISIPFNRAIGLVLLAFVVLVPVALTINGYDSAREGWEGELRRIGGQDEWKTNLNNLFQMLAGLGLIGGGVIVAVTMGQRSRLLATSGGVFLAIAGALTLVSAALYAGFAELAREFTEGNGDASTAGTARGLVLVMGNTVIAATLCTVIGVFTTAVGATRLALLPRWLRVPPALAAVSIFVAFALDQFEATDTAAWLTFMVASVLVLGWLLVAGAMLALRRVDAAVVPPTRTPA